MHQNFTIRIGGREIAVSPFTAGELRRGVLDLIQEIDQRGTAGERFGGQIEILGIAIRRSDTSISDNDIEAQWDFADVNGNFALLMRASRLVPSGEGAAAQGQTGPASMGSSAPPAGSRKPK